VGGCLVLQMTAPHFLNQQTLPKRNLAWGGAKRDLTALSKGADWAAKCAVTGILGSFGQLNLVSCVHSHSINESCFKEFDHRTKMASDTRTRCPSNSTNGV
jgi:hypothetical protein